MLRRARGACCVERDLAREKLPLARDEVLLDEAADRDDFDPDDFDPGDFDPGDFRPCVRCLVAPPLLLGARRTLGALRLTGRGGGVRRLTGPPN